MTYDDRRNEHFGLWLGWCAVCFCSIIAALILGAGTDWPFVPMAVALFSPVALFTAGPAADRWYWPRRSRRIWSNRSHS